MNISDVSALAENFGGQVVDYAVEVGNDENGWVEIANLPFRHRIVDETDSDYFELDATIDFELPMDASLRVVPFDAEGNSGLPSVLVPLGRPVILGVSPLGGREGQGVTFTANVVGTPPLSYEWTFGDAGIPTSSVEANPGVTLGGQGEYTISLTVTNSFGKAQKQFSFTIRPPDSPLIEDIQPRTGYNFTEVQFSAAVSGNAPFAYEWSFPESWTVDNPYLESPKAQVGEAGNFTVALRAANELGEDTAEVDFQVLEGDPPTILEVSPSPAILATFTEATFSAVVVGSQPMNFYWNFGGGAWPNESNEESPTVSIPFAGLFQGYLIVSNAIGSARYDFTLEAGNQPDIVDVSPRTGERGYEIQFSANVMGTSPFSYLWDFSNIGLPITTSEANPSVTLDQSRGSYVVTLIVSNKFGADFHAFNFNVTENEKLPNVLGVSPKNGKPGIGMTISAQLAGQPPFTYTWNFGGGAEPNVYEGSGEAVSATVAPTMPGFYDASLDISNSFGSTHYDFRLQVGYNEVENNDLVPQANPLPPLPIEEVWGNLGPFGYDGDQNDYYSLSLDAGTQLRVELDFDLDTELEMKLIDENGEVRAESFSLGNGAQVLVWNVQGSGTYYLRCFHRDGDESDYKFSARAYPLVQWDSSPVISEGFGGFNASLASVVGRPAVSFTGPGGVSFGLNSQVDGSGDWTVISVSNGSEASNLAVINGYPALAFTIAGMTSVSFNFAIAGDWDGLGSWTSYNLGNFGVADKSVAEVADTPAIAYINNSDQVVRFTRNDDSQGAGTWSTTVVDDTMLFETVSLVVSDGKPAVAYSASSAEDSGHIRFAINELPDGSGTWTVYSVYNAAGKYFTRVASAVINGYPSIAFLDGDTGQVYYARSQTSDGSGAWDIQIISGGVYFYLSLASVNDLPFIAGFRAYSRDLVVVWNDRPDGSGVWTEELVDPEDDVGQYCSITEIDGKPAVAFLRIVETPTADYDPVFARREG